MTAPLFWSKFLSSREQTDRFTNALVASLRSLRRVNPRDKITTIAGCELLKKLPSLWVFLEGFSNVLREVGDGRFCGISIVRWCRCKAGLGEQVCRLELGPPFSIQVRPLACGLPRRDLHNVSIVIDAFDQTVDPSEAQRFTNHVFVGDRFLPGVSFIENGPDSWAGRLIACQPCPPIFAACEVQGYEVLDWRQLRLHRRILS